MDARVSRVTFKGSDAETFLSEYGRHNNRALNKNRVGDYAEMMRAGRWVASPAIAIVVGEDGKLIDGHHRLKAASLAGVPVDMYVIHGEPMATLPAVDVGQTRSAKQVAKLTGDDTSCDHVYRTLHQAMYSSGYVGQVTLERYREKFSDGAELVRALAKITFSGSKRITAGAQAGVLLVRGKIGAPVDGFAAELAQAAARMPCHPSATNLLRWLENKPSRASIGGSRNDFIAVGISSAFAFVRRQESLQVRKADAEMASMLAGLRAEMEARR